MCLMYHAACKVEFQPFKRSYSQLTFSTFIKGRYFILKVKNVSCEYDRLNGWNSILQAAYVCIEEIMQENTHVHRCLVAEDPAGMFHARSTGRWSVRATCGKKERRVIEDPRQCCVALFLVHLPLALVLSCPTFPQWRGQMFRTNVEFIAAAAAAVWQLQNDVVLVCRHPA